MRYHFVMSYRENIYLPLVLSDEKPDLMKERLDEIQDRLGISEILEKYPYKVKKILILVYELPIEIAYIIVLTVCIIISVL